MLAFIKILGPLRIFLIVVTLILIILRPAPGTGVSYEGWQLVTTLLLPVFTPIFFMLMMLDAIMTKLLLSAKPAELHIQYRRVVWLDLALGILLLLYWLPYFIALNQP